MEHHPDIQPPYRLANQDFSFRKQHEHTAYSATHAHDDSTKADYNLSMEKICPILDQELLYYG
jgi:hypothetical protein